MWTSRINGEIFFDVVTIKLLKRRKVLLEIVKFNWRFLWAGIKFLKKENWFVKFPRKIARLPLDAMFENLFNSAIDAMRNSEMPFIAIHYSLKEMFAKLDSINWNVKIEA